MYLMDRQHDLYDLSLFGAFLPWGFDACFDAARAHPETGYYPE